MDIKTILERIRAATDQSSETDPKVKIILNNQMDELHGFDSAGSWRGSYDTPCLFLGGNDSTVALIQELETLTSGKTYQGWKGGNFHYDTHEDLMIEPSEGTYSGTGVLFDIKWLEDQKCIGIFYAV